MEHLASWTEIDLDFKKGRVLMNTVSINPDSSNTFFSTFERTPTDKNVSEIIAASSSHAVKMDVAILWSGFGHSMRTEVETAIEASLECTSVL